MQRIDSAGKLRTVAALLVCLLFSVHLFAQTPGLAVPQLATLSPPVVTVGSFDFTLTVNGSNFTRTAVVRVNGNDRVTTYLSSTQLRAVITSHDLNTFSGQLRITVLNPGPHGAESQALTLLLESSMDPLISVVSPSKIIAGSGATSIVVNGSYFWPDSVIQINGSNRPTVNTVEFSQAMAQLSSNDTATPGFLKVSVFSPSAGMTSNVVPLPIFSYGDVGLDGAITVTDLIQMANSISGTSVLPEPAAGDLNLDGKVDTTDLKYLANYLAGNIFTLPVAAPPSTLNDLSPAKIVTTGGGYASVTIDGIYFRTDSVVRINGLNRFTQFVNSGRLIFIVSPVDLAGPGILNVSVFSPSAGASTNALPLTVFRYGDINFDNSITISDLLLLENIIAGNATPIDPVTADLNLDGKIDTTDQTILANYIAGNIHSLPVLGPNPVLNDISPQKVVAGGPALTLTIDGSNFPSNSVVQLNGSNRPTSFVSPNRLTATIPATDIALVGFLDVSVFSPDAAVNSNGVPLTIFRYGDLNFDNIIDTTDLALMGNFIGGVATLPDTAPADLNLDGRVDAADQTILANYLAGNIPSLPVVSDFSISTSVDSQTINAGDTANFSVSTTALNGFSGNITLSVGGLPWGASGSFYPTTITGTGSATAYISTSAQTAGGSYTLTITGQSGSLTHSMSVVLTVNAAPPTGGCGLDSPSGGLKDDPCLTQ